MDDIYIFCDFSEVVFILWCSNLLSIVEYYRCRHFYWHSNVDKRVHEIPYTSSSFDHYNHQYNVNKKIDIINETKEMPIRI